MLRKLNFSIVARLSKTIQDLNLLTFSVFFFQKKVGETLYKMFHQSMKLQKKTLIIGV